MRKKCFGDPETLMKFKARGKDTSLAGGREFAKFLRSLEQFIQTIQKFRTIFGNRMFFLTCSWRFLNNLIN